MDEESIGQADFITTPGHGSALFSEDGYENTNLTDRKSHNSDIQDSQTIFSEQQFAQSERYIPSPLENASRLTDRSQSAKERILDLVPAPIDHGDDNKSYSSQRDEFTEGTHDLYTKSYTNILSPRSNEGYEGEHVYSPGGNYHNSQGHIDDYGRMSGTPSDDISEGGASSLPEKLKNAEPMIRQGSEFNLLNQRLGSMQSIPEHEPPRSDVFGSDVYHIKDSLGTESEFAETESQLFDHGLTGGINKKAGFLRTGGSGKSGGRSSSKKEGRGHSVASASSSTFINAAEKGDVEAVRKALDNPNLDPDRKVKYQSRSVLHLAAGYGQYGVVEELLFAGADPVSLSSTNRTPLHEACAGGHENVLQLLLDYTREFDLKDVDGRTPSHIAAFHGEVKCLEVLLDKGAAQIITDKVGRQPAHLAAMRDHRNILEYLYDKGIDLASRDSQGKLPVHYAAQYGALDLLICLVERECDITLEDNNGNLPIHFAAWNDHLNCVRFLLKHGSSIEATQLDGRTPAHVAAAHGSHRVLHWLCTKGANVDALDNNLNTPLHLAGETGKAKCFNCLLQHDSDLNAINNFNDTPFNGAKKAGHKHVIEKSISNEIACPLCKQKFEFEEWEDLNGPAPVVRTVTQMGKKAFINPVPKLEKTKTAIELSAERRRNRLLRNKQQKKKEQVGLGGGSITNNTFLTQNEVEINKKKLPRRDLAAKYFGDYLTNEMYKLKT